MTDTIYNVDATALFFARPEPDHMDLLDALNARFSGTDGCYLTKSALSHDDWWLLSCEAFHIMISFKDHRAPEARFADAARSPINTLNRFEYEHVADNHHAHVNIEIGDGSAPLPPEARKIMQEFGTVSQCDPALKLKALHLTSQFIARHVGFLALHFGPSDRLLSPEDMKAAADQDVPVPLLLHPVPTEIALDDHGRETYALRLKNAHHLTGPSIELEGIPRAVPLGTAVTLLTTLFKANRAGKVALKDGDVLSPSKKWSLYVHALEADEMAPEGRIVLSFYKDRVAHAPVVTQPEAPITADAPAENTATPNVPFALRALSVLRKSDPEAADTAQAAQTATSRLTGIVRSPKTVLAKSAQAAVTPELRPVTPTAAQDLTTAQVKAKQTPAPESEPRQRVSLLGWMVDRCNSLPLDARVRASGLVIIAGLLTWANPYGGFTGGHDVAPAQIAQAPAPVEAAPVTFAAIWN